MAITGNTSETKSTNITGKSAYTIYAGATRATVQASGNTPENAQIN